MAQRLDELLQDCTVKITVPDQVVWGTGFFVAPGLILTCAHVVKALKPGDAAQLSWRQQEIFAEALVVQTSINFDLALLRLSSSTNGALPCVNLGQAFQPNDDLYTYGYPDSFPQGTSVTGVCEGSARENGSLLLIFKSAQIRPGLSGSPLLNLNTGRVCGIITFTRDRSIDLGGGAIPASAILEQFPQLKELQQQFHQYDRRWLISTTTVDIPENLPRSGVLEFVGRQNVMTQLHQILQQDSRAAISAIAGMGGIGKTELALQYALHYRIDYPGGICWLSARGTDVGTQVIQFARSLLNLNPSEDLDLENQVKFCWRNWQAGSVLLIFDDVTDYSTIEPFFPPVTEHRFKVLITTRLRLGQAVNQLELEVLNELAALALLESLAGEKRIKSEPDQAEQLCEKLGYLPLGLELVGRYLARKPDLSVSQMLQRLQAKQLEARALCQTEDDMTAELGIAAAFELSWETLSEEAQYLGALLGLFAAASLIPWFIVEQCLDDRDPENLEDTCDELLNLHLLKRAGINSYRLHPLMRDFLKIKINHSLYSDHLKQKICQVLSEIAQQIPERASREEILAATQFIPHLIEIATFLQDWLDDDNLVIPYTGLGWFYYSQGVYSQAETWLSKCCNISQTRLSSDCLSLAASLNNLSIIYREQGRYEEAELLCQQALEIREQQLGAEHLDVAQSLNNLAILHRIQGDNSKAEALHLRTLSIREQKLGTNHLDVAVSLNNLAFIYYCQEHFSEAEPLYQRSLSIREKYLGLDHPDVAQTLNNLAILYRDQQRYSEAEPLHLKSLRIREQQLSNNHTHLGYSLSDLATCYCAQGRYYEAEIMYKRAIMIFEQSLGISHPNRGRALSSLAALYAAKRFYLLAESKYLEALKILRQSLGENHSWTVQCYKSLEKLRGDTV